jgi:hypothetical protein
VYVVLWEQQEAMGDACVDHAEQLKGVQMTVNPTCAEQQMYMWVAGCG